MFASEKRFDYLDTEDKYYLAKPDVQARIAVIGLGINGRGHIRSALTEGRAEIGGVFDPHRGSVDAAMQVHEQFASTDGIQRYRSIEEAVEDTSIDGYIIATPNHRHLEVLKNVLQGGRPIFLEKPMASTITDAAEIYKLVETSGIPVQVGLQYRYKAIYSEAIAEINNRRSIGSIRTLSITEHRVPFLDKVAQWNKFSRYSGGTLVEKCCHYFDLFNLFAAARPVRVLASGSQAVNYRDFEYNGELADILDNASVIVEYANGVRATFDLCMFSPMYYEELVACGDSGRLRTFEQTDFTASDSFKSGLEIYGGELKPTRFIEPRYVGAIRDLGHSGADFFAQRRFVNLLLDHSTETPGVEEGFWSVVVGAAAEEAVTSGSAVNIAEFLSRHGVHD